MYPFSKTLFNNIFTKSGILRQYCINISSSKRSRKVQINANKTYGQPTAATHPHLLKDEEVTPHIKLVEFQERRRKLIESIHKQALKDVKRHLVIVPSASKQYMSDKIPYVFRQNTDFLYLSGCLEPDSCLVLSVGDSSSQYCATLFMREKDSYSELWDGPRTGVDESVALFGVDQALPVSELENYVQSFVKSDSQYMLWYDYLCPVQKNVDNIMQGILNKQFNKMWDSPTRLIHNLRLIKSPAEIDLMLKSCDIASEAIKNTIKFSKPGVSEHHLFANVEYECKMNGAEYLAYPPVVAGGNRANVIHYINNNQVVLDGEMVLMDAGCEYRGYSSDITRTWPINGKFTSQQREIYEILLSVQTKLIEQLANFPTLDSLFESMCLILGKHLQEIGFLSKSTSENELIKAAYKFCPHHVSHYLGMDVHDTHTVTRTINTKPGMIITVEPGMYISHSHRAPNEFKGMGIRIEDDVLITENGPVVLTKNCPRLPTEIENLVGTNKQAIYPY